MKKKILCAALLLTIFAPLLHSGTIMSTTGQKVPPPWDWKWDPYGPRSDIQVYKIILAYESRLVAFEADEIDYVGGIRPEHVDRLKKNRPDAFFLESMSYSIGALQFNIRPKKEPSGEDNYPMNVPEFRKALAHMIDREGYVIPEAYKGYGVAAYTLMPGLYGDWISPKAKTYEYNMDKARKLLDDTGFKVGDDGWRIDPRTGKPLREFEIINLPEAQVPHYFMTSKHIVSQAAKLGIRMKIRTVDAPTLDRLVTETHEHDMYMLGWSLGIYPTFLYSFFRSEEEVLGGWNECGVRNSELDDHLKQFYFAPNVDEAKIHCHKSLDIVQEIVPWVPTVVPIGITAVNGKLRGMVIQRVPGADTPLGFHWLTEQNVHIEPAVFGYTFRNYVGINLGTLNPMTYLWAFEAEVINDIYEFNTMGDPADPYKRIHRLTEKIDVEVFEISPGKKGTKITMTLKKGLTWQDAEPLTAKDYNFTVWRAGHEWKTRRYWVGEMVKKAYKTEVPNPQTFIIYVEGTSFLFQVEAEGYRPLPEHIFSQFKDPKKEDPATLPHPKIKGLTMMIGQGPWVLKEYVPGTHVVNVWNPLYHMRHPEKGLSISFTKMPTTLFADDIPVTVELKITDYAKRPVTNATVSVSANGKTYVGKHVKDGLYTFSISDLPMTGTLSVNVKAEQVLPFGYMSKIAAATVTVYLAKWLIATIVIAVAVIAAAIWFTRRRKAPTETKPPITGA